MDEPADSTPFLEFKDVHFGYPGEKVLEGLSFSVEEGGGLVLVSLTGGGKSTVIRMAAGLVHPDQGVVRIRGRDLGEMGYDEHRAFLRETGFVFQNSALLINQRVFDNVALQLRYHEPGLGEEAIGARVEEALRRFDILHKAAEFPATLSTGERRQVNFARAMVMETRLLLLDDPFVGVAQAAARKIAGILRELKESRRVTLLVCAESVSHLVDTGLVERIGVLKRGRVARIGGVGEYLQKNTRDLRKVVTVGEAEDLERPAEPEAREQEVAGGSLP